MKTRIIAAAALLPLLLIAVLALPYIVTAIAFSVMSAIAAWELLRGTGLVTHKRLAAYSMVVAFCVPIWCYFGRPYAIGLAVVLLFTVLLFAEMMRAHLQIPFQQIAICYVAGLLIPFLFSSLIRIHVGAHGRQLILLPMVLAFLPDTGAYFAGRFFGKHKLAPVISPKKTVEGVVGGVLSAMLGMLIYSFVLDVAFGFTANYAVALLYGLVGSLGAVFGDLCFSVIKRQTGIKDYGNLIPGHGGILDRFDSMMIVGPLAEVLLLLLPVVV